MWTSSIGLCTPLLHSTFTLCHILHLHVVTIFLVHCDRWLLFRCVTCIAQNSLSSPLGVPLLHAVSQRKSGKQKKTQLNWFDLSNPENIWSQHFLLRIFTKANLCECYWPQVQSGTSFLKLRIPPQSPRNDLPSDMGWWNKQLGKCRDRQLSFR